jgi:hypothetical protein
MLLGVLKEWKLAPVAVYGRVVRFTCLWLLKGRIGEAGVSSTRVRS